MHMLESDLTIVGFAVSWMGSVLDVMVISTKLGWQVVG